MPFTDTLPDFTASEVLPAADLQTLSDALAALSGAWTSYTPALTNVTLGNGTLTGKYMQVGKLILFKLSFTFGSASAFSSGPTFGLPVAGVDALWSASAFLLDSSTAANRQPAGALPSTTTVQPYVNAGGLVTATVPFTWAISDVIRISGVYEAA